MLSKQQLLRLVEPDETAAEFLARQVTEAVPTGVPCIDQALRLRPGHVLEITGPTASGKSELLAQIAAHFVTTPHGGDDGSIPSSVLLIDLDSKFDPLRMVQIITHILSRSNAQDGSAMHAAMSRFHLVRCRSSAQLLALLATLPQRLRQMQVKCPLLLIDSIGSYSWQDRGSRPPIAAAAAAGAMAPPGPASDAAGPPLTLQRVHTAAAALLRLLAARLRLAVIATKLAAVGWQDGSGGEAAHLTHRETLPPSWQRIVTHRLLLLPARPPVVDSPHEALTHINAQLQAEATGRREAVVSLYIGTGGLVARPQ